VIKNIILNRFQENAEAYLNFLGSGHQLKPCWYGGRDGIEFLKPPHEAWPVRKKRSWSIFTRNHNFQKHSTKSQKFVCMFFLVLTPKEAMVIILELLKPKEAWPARGSAPHFESQ
jgi:hypothetical protein